MKDSVSRRFLFLGLVLGGLATALCIGAVAFFRATDRSASATSALPQMPSLVSSPSLHPVELSPPELLKQGLTNGAVDGAMERARRHLEQHPELLSAVMVALREETNTTLVSLLGELALQYGGAREEALLRQMALGNECAEKQAAARAILSRKNPWRNEATLEMKP